MRRGRTRWRMTVLGIGAIVGAFAVIARAQDERAPTPPASPSPFQPIPSAPPQAAPTTVEQLAARLRAMEEANKKLAEQLERTTHEHVAEMNRLRTQYEELSTRLNESGKDAAPVALGIAEPDLPPDGAPTPLRSSPVPDYQDGWAGPDDVPAPELPFTSFISGRNFPLQGSVGPGIGFQFKSPDDEFRLQLHYESQIEARIWDPSHLTTANSGIYLPRQRIFFRGNITRPLEYEISINRGLNSINLLNAYANLHLDDRFEIRVGRYLTPVGYDQYAISNYWMPTPERSVFTTNVGLNRQIGAMAWGYLFDKRLDYAAGFFNGSRNSFNVFNNSKDFIGYVNARPFQQSESLPFARFLNVGTSVAYGGQNQPPVPATFSIASGSPNGDVDTPGSATAPFLALNPGVIERGNRLIGSVHTAYYWSSLSLIGEWQYGYGNYATAARPSPVEVPFSGFYVTGGYFLTGENVERRAMVTPLRPFTFGKLGDRGPGAWELVGRVSELRLGESVFTGGFADPNRWSNQAVTTELGANWYWNEYTKIYMFWLHGAFGSPVMYGPGEYQRATDMFWLRFQLYF